MVPYIDRLGSIERGTGSSAKPFWGLLFWSTGWEYEEFPTRQWPPSVDKGRWESCCRPGSTRKRFEGLGVRRPPGSSVEPEPAPLQGMKQCLGWVRGSWHGSDRCNPRPNMPGFLQNGSCISVEDLTRILTKTVTFENAEMLFSMVILN